MPSCWRSPPRSSTDSWRRRAPTRERTVIDWFAGIGCARLAFERAGWRCVWSCELDPTARAVYARRFGHEPDATDIRDVRADEIPAAHCWVAGFPCQDISSARTRNSRRGLAGDDSGLWSRLAALLTAALRPRFLVLENSPDWRCWMPTVRADLAQLGYASLPLVLSAGAFGAPH